MTLLIFVVALGVCTATFGLESWRGFFRVVLTLEIWGVVFTFLSYSFGRRPF